MWFNFLKLLPRNRWLLRALVYGALPLQVAWEVLQACVAFTVHADDTDSPWEWVSVGLAAIVVVGTLGAFRGWWV